MAMPTYGVTFLPQGDALYRKGDGGATGTAPLQEAVRVLSLRVPNVIGNNPMAPLALLNAPGGKDVPAGLLQQLLRQQGVMGQQPAPGSDVGGPEPQTGPDTAPSPSGSEIASAPVSSPTVAGPGAPGASEAAPAPIGAATPLSSLLGSAPSQMPSGVPTVRPTVTGGQTSAPLQPATPTLPLQPNQPVPAIPTPRVTPGALPGLPEPPAPPPSPAPVPPPEPMPTPGPRPTPAIPTPPPIADALPSPTIPGQEPIGAEQAPWKVVQELLRRLGGRQ
jgi:hypothetical protein